MPTSIISVLIFLSYNDEQYQDYKNRMSKLCDWTIGYSQNAHKQPFDTSQLHYNCRNLRLLRNI